jgi:Caspase domain
MSDRRFLITIGSPECPRLGLAPLARVAEDVRRVRQFFTSAEQGYEQVLAAEIPLAATARQIQDGLVAWFAREDGRDSDCVLVYVAGHGDFGEVFRDHCLLTVDSEQRLVNSIIRTGDLVRWMYGGGRGPQNVLLILDVCYAGQGAGEVGAELSKVQSRALGGGAGFWVIATSDPNSAAGDGAFVDAFLATMQDEAWVARGGARFVSPGALCLGVNDWFQRRRHPQKALLYIAGGGGADWPFIRNPGFTRYLDGVSVADLAHWDPKARGVDAPTVPGWFFTGRREVRRELSAWLQAPRSDLLCRVVTGGPGSGKSAVLGWLVLASRQEPRRSMQDAGLLADPLLAPPVGSLAVRVHARGMRLTDMTTAMAASLAIGAAHPAALVAELARLPGPIGIVVDSLDEAAEAVTIERELLLGLAACPPVRLVVGTRRRDGRPSLAEAAVVLDLDDPRYFARADLVEYVVSRLTASGAAYAPAAWHTHARRIAELVADRAGHSFLYARLVARSIALAAEPLDTGRDGWQELLHLPEDLPQAFGADLDRFDRESRRRFVDLLVPLAYARGKGLPQKNIWAAVASRIAARSYSNADLRELKEQVGYYLVQDTESGEVVFRLFHQTFADYLRDLTRDEDVERSFAAALLALVPALPAGAEPWGQVREPYLLRHFPSHAAAGGLLDQQLQDAGFLLHVSPDALLPELHRAGSPEARKIARAYRRASHWIRGGEDGAALSYLLWGAYQHGARDLAQRLNVLVAGLPWYSEWAVWQTVISGHVIARTESAVTALVASHDEQGRPVVVCGYHGGAIRVWDLATSEARMEYRPSKLREPRIGPIVYPPAVTNLVVAACDRRSLIVCAWNEGSIGALDLGDGAQVSWWASPDSADRPAVLCAVQDDAGTLLVAGMKDLSLCVWQLPSLTLVERKNAVAAPWFGLAPLSFQGEAAVVSGTDYKRDGAATEEWPVRIWRARDLKLLWRAGEPDVASATEVRPCTIDAGSWILVRQVVGEVKMLNPATGEVLSLDLQWEDRLWGMLGIHRDGASVYLIGQASSSLRIVRLHIQSESSNRSLTVELLPVRIDVAGSLWSEIAELNGRAVLVSAETSGLRVWDVEEVLAAGTTRQEDRDPQPFGGQDSSLMAVAADDSSLLTGSIDSLGSCLRLWGVDGNLRWVRRSGDGERISQAAMTKVDGRPAFAWVSSNGLLHAMSVADGAAVRPPVKLGANCLALAVREVEGRPVAFVAVQLDEEERHYVVRAWDLQIGEEIDTSDSQAPEATMFGTKVWALESAGYYKTKMLRSVTALALRGRTIVAFGGPHGEVRAVDLGSLQEVDSWVGGVSGDYVHSLAMEVCDGRLVVYGGDERGRLFVRDLDARQDMRPRLESAHTGHIDALVVSRTAAGIFVVSGGRDGVVNFWSSQLDHLARIEAERPVRGLALIGKERLAVATDRGLTLLHLDWPMIRSGASSKTRG